MLLEVRGNRADRSGADGEGPAGAEPESAVRQPVFLVYAGDVDGHSRTWYNRRHLAALLLQIHFRERYLDVQRPVSGGDRHAGHRRNALPAAAAQVWQAQYVTGWSGRCGSGAGRRAAESVQLPLAAWRQHCPCAG